MNEAFTPWEQEVLTLLRRIALAVEHLEAHQTANKLPQSPAQWRRETDREARRNAR